MTLALREDRGSGDHTSLSTISPGQRSTAKLLIKEKGILAGVELAKTMFRFIDPTLHVVVFKTDGSRVRNGDVAFRVQGKTRSILLAERLLLNTLQRMSGIATHTAALQALCKGTRARILDTRKTTPNFRFAEKWAVCIGGGMNHRFGLYDMILVKDNHIDACGGIKPALENVRKYLRMHKLKIAIEVEARTLGEVREILRSGGVNRILLDNMTIATMKRAVKLIGKKAETEASGGITRENLAKVARTGVDFISVGALTHHVKSMDMSLKIEA